MNGENENNIVPIPGVCDIKNLSPEEIQEEISAREIELKKVQREIERLAPREEILKQEIALLRENRED